MIFLEQATVKRSAPALKKIAVIGNYLPRRCGIATFTSHLVASLKQSNPGVQVDVIVMNEGAACNYPPEVKLVLGTSDFEGYAKAAEFLNAGDYDVVSVQHEYGIFGGEAGAFLLSLLREVKVPIVTTMHTILREPNAAQHSVTSELLQLSSEVIVMSEKGKEFLSTLYGVAADNVELIPHGIPDFSTATVGKELKAELNIDGPMILTFGLLSPDKGIQYAIEALPGILAQSPGATYVVLGATHPNIKANVGEVYRDSLVSRARELGIEENVRFIDQFVSEEELVDYIVAADVYITPYLNPQQITSGTLAYALGAGKAVISTPYWYAQELLADDRGILVPFRDSAAISDAINRVNSDRALRSQMEIKAGEFSRETKWTAIGARYNKTLSKAVESSVSQLQTLIAPRVERSTKVVLPKLSTAHLSHMTDDTGLFQHAFYSIPNRFHGYCIDDNARALLLTALFEAPESTNGLTSQMKGLQLNYLAFVTHAYNEENGRFRNFMDYGRTWLESEGSDDSHARTVWALGTFINRTKQGGLTAPATELFLNSLPAVWEMQSPRAWAYSILGCEEFLASSPDSTPAAELSQEMASRLLNSYRICRGDEWRWFEDVLSYANARMPEALLLFAERTGNDEAFAVGLESLSWLIDQQRGKNCVFAPIGSNGFYRRGQSKADFDQQPLEVWATVSACISAATVTGKSSWLNHAEDAFAWFLGSNDVGVPVYDHQTGGCRDGLEPDGVNQNQGAESTLSYLCARTQLEIALSGRTNTGIRIEKDQIRRAI